MFAVLQFPIFRDRPYRLLFASAAVGSIRLHAFGRGSLKELDQSGFDSPHLGLEFSDLVTPEGLSAEVKVLADDPAKKIQAIALAS